MSDGAAALGRSGSFRTIESDEPYPGVVRRAFDADRATVTRYEFAARARFPLHKHHQEQIVVVEEGVVEFTVGSDRQRLGPGDFSVVPPEVEHGLQAGDVGARFLAIIVPRREGANAYTVTGDAS
jgi:quercetin dioxygenase-like cupin family protein